MAEETAFKNGSISNFQGLVTLTLTLDRVILHTVMHHSSTSTYMPNFIEIKDTYCGQMYKRTDGYLRPTWLGRLLRRVDLIKYSNDKANKLQNHTGNVKKWPQINPLRRYKRWYRMWKMRWFHLLGSHSMSLEIASFDTAHASSTVTTGMSLSCTVSEI